jgi:hypothetical protein
MLSTAESTPPWGGVAEALERWLRPAIGFSHPRDVLKDPGLDAAEKQAVLSSWASDASAVEGEPTLRWLFGTQAPVPLAEVREALARLDPPDRAAPTHRWLGRRSPSSQAPPRRANLARR